MATVKIQRVKGKNPITKEEFYYVRTKTMGIMSTDDLVENIVREGQIPRIYAQGVLDYLTTAMFDYMKAGLAVQVPGLGTMRLNVTSKAQAEEKDATARTITGTKLRLYPFEKTRQEMKNFRFELIGDTVEAGDEEEEEEIPVGPGGSGSNTGGSQTGGSGSNTGGSQTGGSGSNTGGSGSTGSGSNETPTDPTKILLLFNDGAHNNVIVKRMEVAPGYQLTAADLPEGYVYAFKTDDQADIDAASPGDTVWVTLTPRG